MLRRPAPARVLQTAAGFAEPQLEGTGVYEVLDRVYRTAAPYVSAEQPLRVQVTPEGGVFVVGVLVGVVGADAGEVAATWVGQSQSELLAVYWGSLAGSFEHSVCSTVAGWA